MITNERKQLICEKYDIYLRIINVLGNKIMLQKQLIQIVLELGVAKNSFEAMRAILELEEAEIIKKIKFSNTTQKFILFKKYAIRYLAGVGNSNDVASLLAVNSNKRYIESIMKVEFILKVLIPTTKKVKGKIDFDILLNMINELNCNILHKANDMEKYYKNILSKSTIKFEQEEVENDMAILIQEKKIRMNNLNGIESTIENKRRKNKEEYLYTSNLATLARKNIFIANINHAHKPEKTKVIAYYFNTSVDKNTVTVALNYSILYNTLKRLFGSNVVLELRVVLLSEIIKNNLVKDLSKRYINPRTKEETQDNYLTLLLKSNGLTEIDFSNMEIVIMDYKINI